VLFFLRAMDKAFLSVTEFSVVAHKSHQLVF
jgi:hypothetical protein